MTWARHEVWNVSRNDHREVEICIISLKNPPKLDKGFEGPDCDAFSPSVVSFIRNDALVRIFNSSVSKTPPENEKPARDREMPDDRGK